MNEKGKGAGIVKCHRPRRSTFIKPMTEEDADSNLCFLALNHKKSLLFTFDGLDPFGYGENFFQ